MTHDVIAGGFREREVLVASTAEVFGSRKNSRPVAGTLREPKKLYESDIYREVFGYVRAYIQFIRIRPSLRIVLSDIPQMAAKFGSDESQIGPECKHKPHFDPTERVCGSRPLVGCPN